MEDNYISAEINMVISEELRKHRAYGDDLIVRYMRNEMTDYEEQNLFSLLSDHLESVMSLWHDTISVTDAEKLMHVARGIVLWNKASKRKVE